MENQVGILFPISSLPNRYGVGDFGKHAYELVDKLSQSSISLWQILPLNPLGYGNSPYQPLSSQAGDDLYLSLERFIDEGLLLEEEVTYYNSQLSFVAYQDIRKVKHELYLKAFSRFEESDAYHQFIDENKWVHDYAIFKVFKEQNNDLPWIEWDDQYKYYYKNQNFALTPFLKEINYHIFLQFHFFKQWYDLKSYANQKGISIIGDMPIYVGLDSVDVWTNQECFLLEEDGIPSFVAGVPPDYFSKFGQRWGNPLYDWNYLKDHSFDFWVERMQGASKLYDTVRIDHFRAFDTYWKIPESEPTAIIGEWIEAPGYALFDTLFTKIPQLSILAEDLGELREEVYHLRDHYNLKGMYVFQFHHSYDFGFNKVVVYTGTHDNDTLKGWLESLSEEEKNKVMEMLSHYNDEEVYQKVIHYCLDLNASQTIIPLWDMMGEDSSCRFNIPGMIGSPNWEYRITSFDCFDTYLKEFQNIIESSRRKEG